MKNNTKKRIGVFLALFFTPALLFANIGLPMIFISYPLMLAAFLPVVFVESFVISKFTKLPLKESIGPLFIANLATTVVGFPISWGLLLGFELLTTGGSCGPGFDNLALGILTIILESAWLCPRGDVNYGEIIVPLALIVSFIVAFFLSVIVEKLILVKVIDGVEKKKLKRSVWIANSVSYLFLTVYVIISSFYPGMLTVFWNFFQRFI